MTMYFQDNPREVEVEGFYGDDAPLLFLYSSHLEPEASILKESWFSFFCF